MVPRFPVPVLLHWPEAKPGPVAKARGQGSEQEEREGGAQFAKQRQRSIAAQLETSERRAVLRSQRARERRCEEAFAQQARPRAGEADRRALLAAGSAAGDPEAEAKRHVAT